MKILIDISHPAHVHFFKYFIRNMQNKGHDIKITAKDKDLTLKLLDLLGLKISPSRKFPKKHNVKTYRFVENRLFFVYFL